MKQLIDIIVRSPAPSMIQTPFPLRGIPDYARACLQHQDICAALDKAGANIIHLKTKPEFSNGSQIDDIAVITETVAVFSNGDREHSRREEQQDLANLMAQDRILKFISPPGILSGGDVLRINDCFYIGISDKTNEEGAGQLAFFLKEFGYEANILIPERNDIHLKSNAALLPDGKIFISENLAGHYAFLGFDKITVSAGEALAASGFSFGDTYFMPGGLKNAVRQLKVAGIKVCEINVSEFEKTGACLASLALQAPRLLREKTAVILPLREKTRKAA